MAPAALMHIVCTGVPAACLHICGLPERMATLQAVERARQGAGGRSLGGARRLYLLQWFALVGPLLALPLPPAAHQRVARRLLEGR